MVPAVHRIRANLIFMRFLEIPPWIRWGLINRQNDVRKCIISEPIAPLAITGPQPAVAAAIPPNRRPVNKHIARSGLSQGRLAANGIELTRERICDEVASMCGGLVDREPGNTSTAPTEGERAFRRFGVSGARGEATCGYWDLARSGSACL